MDFTTLIVQIQKNPTQYELEFNNILSQYIHLTTLPIINTKQALAYISFLTSTAFFYKSQYPKTILYHYTKTEDMHLKGNLMNNLFILKHKNLIDDVSLFKVLLDHADLTKILSRVILEIRDHENLIELFKTYLHKGDEKQIRFSIFMLCYIYERGGNCENYIVDGLVGDMKIQIICMAYLCNEIEFCKNDKSKILLHIGEYKALKVIEKLCKELKNKDQREIKIKKIKCIDFLKKEYSIQFDISTLIFYMIDPSKDDLKVLMELLVDNLDTNLCVLEKLIKTFCAEYRDDDFIIYGLNFLKIACLKYEIEDFIMERIKIFNKNKSSSVNVAYRGIIKALKEKVSDGKEILHVKRKATKSEKIEAAVNGKERKKFKAKDRKKKKPKRLPIKNKYNKSRGRIKKR